MTGIAKNWLDPAFEAIAIDDEGRACVDIPESACRDEPGNFFTHVVSLALSKSADSLIDPKLVLSWLITAIGAPAALIGLLVPIREAGALLPQLFTAGFLRRLPRRKWAWAFGAIIQGMAAISMAFSALLLSGFQAGLAIICALAVLAVARSVCSVCYKDVLGKTVDKSRRGRTTGLAGSISAGAAIVFAAILFTDVFDRYALVVGAIGLAGVFWIAAGGLFTTLSEKAGATEGGASAFRAAIDNFSYLRSERQLRIFILTRGFLTSTALAPPFIVALGSTYGSGLSNLGLLILASAAAGLVSSFLWGRFADRSSRKVLILAALTGSTTLLGTAALSSLGMLSPLVLLPLLLFFLMISHQGVRLGRSTHLVDMADERTRAPFTALSNTIIGVVLLLGGAFGLLANFTSLTVVIATMGLMCAVAFVFAIQLEEVQAG